LAITPWPSLIYRGPGVVVVGISPLGAAATKPSRLFLSTDMAHWTDITPPQSQTAVTGTYDWFQQASFLNPRTGWVTSWSSATVKTTIYRTSDGGRTWTTVPGGGHSGNAGAASLIDLVSPTTGFEETLEPTAPLMSLASTTDSGQTWKTVYAGPPPTPSNGRYQGPFEMGMTFTDARHGFAAVGVPPAESLSGEADFFNTSDGGATWLRQSPPLPDSPLTCPKTVLSTVSSACLYTLPDSSDTRHGVLSAVVTAGTQAYIGFDLTSDGGLQWTKASQVSVTVTPNPVQGGIQGSTTFGYPLISLVSATSWWVLGWSGSTATTELTTNGGTHWTTNDASLPPGSPTALAAIDGTHALLTVEDVTANSATTHFLATADGGHTWTTLNLLA
jgi:photosystem II stability/assembly factor-like uncharacterized protein